MLEFENCDETFHDYSIMLHSDPYNPTFRSELLSPKDFDYSLRSLENLEAYLRKIRKDKNVEADWNRTVLRCGAYVGEVIRLADPDHDWHWIDFATAQRLNPKNPLFEAKSIGKVAILVNMKESYWFPLAKVCKFLENGEADSVNAFASVAISHDPRIDGLG